MAQLLGGSTVGDYLILSKGNHYNLEHHDNVVITSIADGEILTWDNTNLYWKNETLAEAGISATGHTHAWSDITSGKPTTVSGYGITDAITTSNIGSQTVASCTGNSASATYASTLTLADRQTSATHYIAFSASATGNVALYTDAGLTYNPSTNAISATTFSGALSGNATTSTTLQTARTIAGTSFNGSANIDISYTNLTNIPSTFAPSAHTLDSHSNVTITSNSSGEILKWNGSAWINNTLAEAGIQPAGSYLTANQTITLSGDVSGSGTTSITVTVADNSHNHTLSNISDYTTYLYTKTNLQTSGQASIHWDNITNEPSTYAPSAHTLDSHSNVTITSNSSGEILKWNGSAWINNTLAEAGIPAYNQTMYIGTTAVAINRVSGALVLTGITSIDGNSATATILQTTRTIAGVNFNGSANIDIPFANLTSKPTTLSGYGITDGASSTHTHTYHWGHTYAISGEIKVPSGSTDYIVPFFVPVKSGTTVKIARVRYVIQSGTSVTCSVQKNGSDATGLTSISVTTTEAQTDPTDITLADNDKIALVVTAVSGTPTHLTFTIMFEVTI